MGSLNLIEIMEEERVPALTKFTRWPYFSLFCGPAPQGYNEYLTNFRTQRKGGLIKDVQNYDMIEVRDRAAKLARRKDLQNS